MDVTQITQSGFKWNIRVPQCYQDEHVIFEVVACDQYHLNELASYIYPDVIVDVGGHIGTFGVLAKSVWPEAKLIVVEPSFDNMELYKLNAKANHLTNVTFIPAAIGYNPDRSCLVNSPSTTGGAVMRTRQEADAYVRNQYRYYNRVIDDDVNVMSVEELIKGYDVIGLAKWDCEGGEVDAFMNMSDAAAKTFRFMVGEYHIWSETSDYLRPTLFECIRFWRRVRRKFPHLNWTYKENPLGNFQAWPKEYL